MRIIFWIGCLCPLLSTGQQKDVSGTVRDDQQPLAGAAVSWSGTTSGTVTDESGNFTIKRNPSTTKLIIQFVGYAADTIETVDGNEFRILLQPSLTLDEAVVTYERKTTEISFLNTLKTEKINAGELLKAACCTLSESFETSPSVDVSFTDAITGARQIQMLGLSGPSILITRENIPEVRGLSAIYGLTYTPGPWIESIQLIKGTGSVINGFESIAGQINTELRKPSSGDRFYFNGYSNAMGRLEADIHLRHKLNEKWSTLFLFNARDNFLKTDQNNDSFLDGPVGYQLVGLNRWEYCGPDGTEIQFGIKGTLVDDVAGQKIFNPKTDARTTNAWGMQMKTQRLEGWGKIGKVYAATPWRSMGLQLNATIHRMESYFGLNDYNAKQQSFYANYIYQSMIGNTNHRFVTGASFQLDLYDELLYEAPFKRTESVPGVFFEYSYNYVDKFSLVSGIRVDHNNLYGSFVTPRLHIRYALTDNTVLRLSAGRGQRTTNIIAENMGILASNRQINIEGTAPSLPFGLKPEVAWNAGMSITKEFTLDYREGAFSLDLYHTHFVNQVVVDMETPQEVHFYNLDGKSYATSFQAQADYEIVKRVNLRMAYRLFDVKTTFGDVLKRKPLLASNRAFANVAYGSRNHWKFDYTLNWQGEKRVPSTISNPEPYRVEKTSPSFFQMNAQITKTWREKFDVYIGVENLTNYTQKSPILANESPFSPYFDSSLIWGPVFGRNFYLGVRYSIK